MVMTPEHCLYFYERKHELKLEDNLSLSMLDTYFEITLLE